MRKWAAGLIGGVALGVAGWALWTVFGAFLMPGGLTGECGDEVLQRAPSPDGKSVAQVVRRNCGATIPFVTHVFVTPAGRGVDDQTAEDVAAFRTDMAQVAWRGATLSVAVDAGTEVYSRADRWSGGAVSYRQFPPARAPRLSAEDEAWVREQEQARGLDKPHVNGSAQSQNR